MTRSVLVVLCVLCCVQAVLAQSDPSTFTTVINVPPDPAPSGIGSDTQLNVDTGGRLPFNFTVGPSAGGSNFELNVLGGDVGGNLRIHPGGVVNIEGGEVGGPEITGSVLNMSGGFMGRFTALNETEINVSGGTVAQGWRAGAGSVVNLTGGTLGQNSFAQDGSEVNASGGNIGRRFNAESGSRVTFSGGSVSTEFAALPGSDVRLIGGDFELNGAAVGAGASVTLSGDDLLTGTLEDGSPFIFTPTVGDELNNVQLIGGSLPAIDLTPMTVFDASPLGGLRAGQTLTLEAGGVLRDDFAVIGATLNVAGGRLGNRLEVIDSVVNISGNGNGNGFDSTSAVFAHSGSVINVTDGYEAGGTNVSRLMLFDGAVANIDGGSVTNAVVGSGGEMNITGGFSSVLADVGGRVSVFGGSVSINRQNAPGGDVSTFGGTIRGPIDLSLPNATGRVLVSGGVVEGSVQIGTGSEVTITGGRVLSLNNGRGGDLNISGGFIDVGLTARGVSEIRGGAVGGFVDLSGEDVRIVGGEFLLNGSPLAGGGPVTLSGSDVLTGTLEDGSVFVYTPTDFDRVEGVTFQSGSLPPLDLLPIVVADASGPRGLRPGQTITVVDGGELNDGFGVVDGTLSIDGGVVGEASEVTRGVVNVNGGEVGDRLDALSGGIVNVHGGAVGDELKVDAAGEVNVFGGTVGGAFDVRNGGRLNVSGGVVAGGGDVDGGELNVTGGEVGAFLEATGEAVINVSGGEVGPFVEIANGSRLNLSGGSIGGRLEALVDSEVNVTGGTIGNDFGARASSVVTISGGSIGDSFDAVGQVTISGGVIGRGLDAFRHSEVTISGGRLGRDFDAFSGSGVSFLGGEFRLNGSPITDGSSVTLAESDVLSGTLEDGSVFVFSPQSGDDMTGVALIETSTPAYDTSPISVADAEGPAFLRSGQSLTLESGGVAAAGFAAVGAEVDVAGGSFQRETEVAESVVRMSAGSIGEDFHAASSEIELSGGVVGPRFAAFSNTTVRVLGGIVDREFTAATGTVVTVSGGVIGEEFSAQSDSEVHLSGGQIGPNFEADAGSKLVVTGGVLGDGATVTSSEAIIAGGVVGESFQAGGVGAEVTIAGGIVGQFFTAFSGSEVNILGGTIGAGFSAGGSEVNLFGSSFAIDGVPVDGLAPGEAIEVDERDVLLTGELADGSAINLDLRSRGIGISFSTTLTVTLVTDLPGDFNNDGVVGAADYVVWREHLGDPGGVLLNDTTGIAIGFAQYDLWASNYGASLESLEGVSAVPEPGGVMGLAMLTVVVGLARQRRRPPLGK